MYQKNWLKDTNSSKDMYMFTATFILITRINSSDYRNIRNDERWKFFFYIHSLASFNCFTSRNLFQDVGYDMSKKANMVNDILSKISIF